MWITDCWLTNVCLPRTGSELTGWGGSVDNRLLVDKRLLNGCWPMTDSELTMYISGDMTRSVSKQG